ncbi:uncharacterized protein LOC121384178 [Gigantopelta aegis]|uniref:uncharacterized protein LOC121384178 n=1 Tax=Gigantopelta aegis TaxID=1735272 RepID=UPI001B8893C9|nr:uncharacterized protein LOC121384178 [Gigantopelta aegis]
MEGKKITLPRQMSFSNRNSIMGLGHWKRLLCLVILFTTGLVCGHFIHTAFIPRREVIVPHNVAVDKPVADRRPRHEAGSSIMGRPGLGIKKDLSIQFRDYIPRLIFINCGGTLPRSVKLFLDTYPNSHQFVIFSFISDEVLSPLYEQFPNHKLFAPLACAATNGTVSVKMRKFASNVTTNVTVPTFDIALWIKESSHPDEHIILKIDAEPNVEKAIVARIVETGALEWIDQFYTTSTREDVVEFNKKEFSKRSQDVLLWDDNGTYSDFLKQNPSKNLPLRKNVIKACGNSTKGYHSIFLYASKISRNLNISLILLTELRKTFPSKLPMGLFLPYDFVLSYRERLESMFSIVDIGAYVDNVYPLGENLTDSVHYLQIRNVLVAMENRFMDANGLLENVLAGNGMDETLLAKLISDRNCNVFVKTVDITNMRLMNFEQMPKLPTRSDLQILSIDISEPNTELLVLYLFKQFGYKILPLADCLK